MSWLGSVAIGLGKRLVPSVICWYFTQARGEQHRESDRQRWWTFSESARQTKSKADDALAAYLKARFNYHDSPEVKASKQVAARAGLLHQDPDNTRFSGYHQP